MTSMRESPIRRQPPNRPSWLVPVLVVVGVLVVIGLVYALVSLMRGSDSSSAEDGTTPEPCITRTITPADVLPKATKVSVNVYNASDVSGLASRTARQLRDRGFKVAKIANDPTGRTVSGVGEIRYGPKAAKRAQLLALYVPGAELVALDRPGLKVDLAMGDGFTGVAPQTEVDVALTAPSPVVSGSGCEPSSEG